MAPRSRLLLHALFFLSGVAGLVYQVVWSRLLNEVFGVTAYAVTAVLAAFLGGLAAGSFLLGPASDRARAPLRLYGWLELGVAVTALAGSWLPGLLDPVHVWLASRLPPASPILLVGRVLLAAAVVLPPTFLMGGTLPAMTRAAVDRIGGLGRELSYLYALNTAGAVAGSVLSGFFLIRMAGVHATLWLAVGLNAVVGVAALGLARATSPIRAAAPAEPVSAIPTARVDFDAAWLLGVMAISGVASLSLEVIWTRLLVLVVGTSTYAFATMLTTFLVGIALGSFLLRYVVDRLPDPRRAFGWLQVGIAASTAATIPVMRGVMARADDWIAGAEGNLLGLAGARFAICFLVMLVPTTLIGATFPLASRIWATRLGDLGRRLGQLYGANTAGNILGALVGGFVLLPGLGMQRSIAVATALFLAAAGWGLLPISGGWFRPRALLRAAPISLGLWGCIGALLAWRPGPLPATGGGPQDQLRFYDEGLVATVKVFQKASDGRQLIMAVDGVTIGQSWTGVDRKQQVLAHLPFAIAPAGSVREVMSIGLGTGILVGEVARHPEVREVECAEISTSVIEGAHQFERFSGAEAHPVVRVVADDGVNYLHRSTKRYDAIIADGKSRSGHAGNALFYSTDFYRIALDHLAEQGTMVQWVPLDVTPEDLRTIVRSFLVSFPHAYLWYGNRSCFLVGSRHPLQLDLRSAQQILDADASADVRRHGWRDANELAALLLADQSALGAWVRDEETVNSLEHPVLEFYPLGTELLPERVRVAMNHSALARLARVGATDLGLASVDLDALARDRRGVLDLLQGLAALEESPLQAAPLLQQAAGESPAGGVVHEIAADALFDLAHSLDVQGRPPEALGWYLEALRVWPDLAEAEGNVARLLATAGRSDEALAHCEAALRIDPEETPARKIAGHLLQLQERHAEALPHLAEAVRLAPADPENQEALGLSLVALGRVDEALAPFQEALRLRPDWPLAMGRVAYLLAVLEPRRGGDRARSLVLALAAVDRSRGRDLQLLDILAAAYAAAGRFQEAAVTERRVLEMAEAEGNAGLAAAAREALERYGQQRSPVGVGL